MRRPSLPEIGLGATLLVMPGCATRMHDVGASPAANTDTHELSYDEIAQIRTNRVAGYIANNCGIYFDKDRALPPMPGSGRRVAVFTDVAPGIEECAEPFVAGGPNCDFAVFVSNYPVDSLDQNDARLECVGWGEYAAFAGTETGARAETEFVAASIDAGCIGLSQGSTEGAFDYERVVGSWHFDGPGRGFADCAQELVPHDICELDVSEDSATLECRDSVLAITDGEAPSAE